MLKVEDITIEKLENNEFINELPELYELREVIENNEWHNHDSVFNHTMSVLKSCENILKDVNSQINSYLNEKIGTHTKKQLMFLANLFHDIGKKETMVQQGEDYCLAPKHEEVGAEKLRPMLDRIDLTEKEKEFVIKLVKSHSAIHFIIAPEFKEKEYEEFKITYKDIYLELIIMAMADTVGSQLNENNPEQFRFRINFYKEILKNS